MCYIYTYLDLNGLYMGPLSLCIDLKRGFGVVYTYAYIVEMCFSPYLSINTYINKAYLIQFIHMHMHAGIEFAMNVHIYNVVTGRAYIHTHIHPYTYICM